MKISFIFMHMNVCLFLRMSVQKIDFKLISNPFAFENSRMQVLIMQVVSNQPVITIPNSQLVNLLCTYTK